MAEEELNYPLFVPASHETLGQQAYFCALRLAILQLDVTRRSMLTEATLNAQVNSISWVQEFSSSPQLKPLHPDFLRTETTPGPDVQAS
jgi:hypothetical protein